MERADHTGVDRPAVQGDLQLVGRQGEGEAVPGPVSQPHWKALHLRLAASCEIVNTEGVPPPARLQLQVPGTI